MSAVDTVERLNSQSDTQACSLGHIMWLRLSVLLHRSGNVRLSVYLSVSQHREFFGLFVSRGIVDTETCAKGFFLWPWKVSCKCFARISSTCIVCSDSVSFLLPFTIRPFFHNHFYFYNFRWNVCTGSIDNFKLLLSAPLVWHLFPFNTMSLVRNQTHTRSHRYTHTSKSLVSCHTHFGFPGLSKCWVQTLSSKNCHMSPEVSRSLR